MKGREKGFSKEPIWYLNYFSLSASSAVLPGLAGHPRRTVYHVFVYAPPPPPRLLLLEFSTTSIAKEKNDRRAACQLRNLT